MSGVGVKSWSCRAELAVERKSERADTAYSPRLHELSATANERAVTIQMQSPPAKMASGELVVSPISHDRADQATNEPANQSSAHIAPTIAVTRSVVVMMVVVRIMPMRRRGRMMRDFMPRHVALHWRSVVFASRRLGYLRCLGVPFRRLRLHGSRGFPALRRIALGSCNSRSAESSANCQCQHHFLDCLVHCRVPFLDLRKPILALTPG